MDAIILAGGFGTRLAHVVSDVPKPMATVADRPFLQYILDLINKNEISRAVLAVGYKKECIKSFFGNEYKRCKLVYSDEDTPLLTGGAIKKALKMCTSENVVIVNGDTYFNIDLKKMLQFHREKEADITVAVREMQNFDRYGTVNITNNQIIRFEEKKECSQGIINGGIYILNKSIFRECFQDTFSFESDFLEKYIDEYKIMGFLSNKYFIDIGVEEDFFQAQEDFKNYE